MKLFCFHIGNRIGNEPNETNETEPTETSLESEKGFTQNQGAGVFLNRAETQIFFAPPV